MPTERVCLHDIGITLKEFPHWVNLSFDSRLFKFYWKRCTLPNITVFLVIYGTTAVICIPIYQKKMESSEVVTAGQMRVRNTAYRRRTKEKKNISKNKHKNCFSEQKNVMFYLTLDLAIDIFNSKIFPYFERSFVLDQLSSVEPSYHF